MRPTETERWALSLGACLCLTGVGCGDIGDAQLPLPLHGRTPREPAEEFVRVESGDDIPPEAVVSVVVAPAPEAACAHAFEAQLPKTSALSTLIDGAGPRAVHGQDALISCRVWARPFSDGVFQIDFSVLHPDLTRLTATGQLGPATGGSLALELTTPYRALLRATCPSETIEVVNGAMWFRTRDCRATESASDPDACDVEVDAIFERCGQ